jgi:hypothetical protein
MKPVSGRWICWLFPFLAGCFPLLYAYPSLSFVPPIDAGPVTDKVYAFRVDITDERNGAEFPDRDRYLFREIPVSETARVPLQAKLDVDRGWVFFGPQKYSAHTRHAILVRLYRPGYQTVEVARPGDAKRICWVEAKEVRNRETAVDELLSTWRTDASGHKELAAKNRVGQSTPDNVVQIRCLAPGSASTGHRQFLLFAADQYTAIAVRLNRPDATAEDLEAYQRLMSKVAWLHKRAVE